ncbi:MAG: tetratricopeptide repeat protein [Erythrobacter sp.]
MRYLFLAIALIFSLGNTENASPSTIQELVDRDQYDAAFDLARKDALHGDGEAHDWLGWFYENGRGTDVDMSAAEFHYRAAAREGENHARWRLGVLIDSGEIAGTLEEAVAFFNISADENYADGVVSLAVMQATGRGTQQDYPAALGNYMKAAQLGNDHAVRGVGVMLFNGQGVEANKEEAAAWFLVSAARGNEDGENSLRMVLRELEGIDREALAARAKEIADELELPVDIQTKASKDNSTVQ